MIFYKNCKILLKITIRYEKNDLFHFTIENSFLKDNFVLTFIFDFSEKFPPCHRYFLTQLFFHSCKIYLKSNSIICVLTNKISCANITPAKRKRWKDEEIIYFWLHDVWNSTHILFFHAAKSGLCLHNLFFCAQKYICVSKNPRLSHIQAYMHGGW